MDQQPEQLADQQTGILDACNQPKFTAFVWPENYLGDDATNSRKSVVYAVGNFWSANARQLSTHMNSLRSDLKISCNRMITNVESWSSSRHSAATKINQEALHLKTAMEHFIAQMTSVTLETLGLQGPRTRAGTPNHEEIIAELQTQLQEAQAAISTNLDTVSDQI